MRLTVDAPPETVLAVARIIARDRRPWGALESEDFVSAACLCFYRTRERVHQQARDFHNLMVRSMARAMQDQTRTEARQYGYDRPQLVSRVVQGWASKTRVLAGSGSASPLTEIAQHRRRVTQREHNKTYYYRTVGLQACEVCGTHVNLGHGAKRCQAHATKGASRCRRRRRGLAEPIRYCMDCGTALTPHRKGHCAAHAITNAERCRIWREQQKVRKAVA